MSAALSMFLPAQLIRVHLLQTDQSSLLYSNNNLNYGTFQNSGNYTGISAPPETKQVIYIQH